MTFHRTLASVCAALFILSGSAQAAPVDWYGHDDGYFGSSYGDKGDSGGRHDDKSDKGFSYSSGDGDPHDDWSGDDGNDKWKKVPPPDYGATHDWDGKGDKDKDDYHRTYSRICDKDPGKGDGRTPHDPSCDPLPLPGALPMFGAGLAVLAAMTLLRRTRLRQRSAG